MSDWGKLPAALVDEWTRWLKRSRNVMRVVRGDTPTVGGTPCDVVFQRNKMRLLRYRATSPRRGLLPILFVPSVINRHYILDLQAEKSVVAFFLDQGFDVFMVDWGKPGSEDQYITFDDVIALYLDAAVRRTCQVAGSEQLHLFGHCLGGMLTLTHASLFPTQIASLLNMTTPVDLRHGGILRTWTEFMDVDLMVDALGNAPWPLLQASFHLLKPMALLQKTAWIYERLWDDHTVDSFVALETWSNDNVSISGEFFRTYIKEIYQNNGLYEGTLWVKGQRVDLRSLEMPIMNVAAQGDHIAPEASVVALADLAPQTQNLVVPGGHIGGVISRRASRKVWPLLAEFFVASEAHDGREI